MEDLSHPYCIPITLVNPPHP